MGKILILANNDIGLYKFRKELIEELLNYNEVYISLPYGELVEPLVKMGCVFIDTDVDRRGINPLSDVKLIMKYFKIIKIIKPDLVITYTIKPNIYGGFICRMKHIVYAVNITGLGTTFQNNGLLKKIIIGMYKAALKKSKVIFFENEENQNFFVRNRVVPFDQTCKLNGAGINLDEYHLVDYPSEEEEIRFLFIGRVMKEKGIEEFLDVAEKVKLKYPNTKFDIVGPEEDSYIDRLNNLQARGIINYYGYQKDVKPYIEKAHCFILPSYHEGMANSLLECGAMGRPLITSNISGCREAVIDGITGILVNIKCNNDLYNKVIKFVELPYNQKKNMSILSRKHIENVFDKKKVVEFTLGALKK